MTLLKDVPVVRAMRGGGLAAVLGTLLLAQGIAGPAAGATQLAWTDTYYGAPRLYRARLDGSFPTSRTLVPGSLPEGLAYDPVSGGLFVGEAAWSGAGILRTDAALTAPVAFTAGLSCVRGLAMDEGSGRLYWSTSNVITGSSIDFRTRDGVTSGRLFALGTSINPRGVAVDPVHAQVWWADFDNNAIERCDDNGSNGMVVWFSDPSSRPYGIAYDRGTDRVYWTEYGSGRLMRANRDGTNITVLATGLGNPTHLALDAVGGRLYWVDAAYGQGRVRSAALNGTDLREIAALQTFGGIALVAGSVTDVPAAERYRDTRGFERCLASLKQRGL